MHWNQLSFVEGWGRLTICMKNEWLNPKTAWTYMGQDLNEFLIRKIIIVCVRSFGYCKLLVMGIKWFYNMQRKKSSDTSFYMQSRQCSQCSWTQKLNETKFKQKHYLTCKSFECLCAQVFNVCMNGFVVFSCGFFFFSLFFTKNQKKLLL